MLKGPVAFLLLFISITTSAQKNDKLTVEKIMRDPKWIGTSPTGISWSNDGSVLYFLWNPEKAAADSSWYITPASRTPIKATVVQKQLMSAEGSYNYNEARTAYVYTKDGDILYRENKTGRTIRITQTTDTESNPQFSFNETKIVYTRSSNLFAWDMVTGETMQLTNVKTGDVSSATGSAAQRTGNPTVTTGNQQEQWLRNDQLQYLQVLKERKEKRDLAEVYNKSIPKTKELRSISLEDKSLQGISISPDGRFVSYRLFKATSPSAAKNTIVPSYVTETGFTTDIPGRTKVGTIQGSVEFFVYDRIRDTVISLKADSIPGIQDLPDYVKDYPKQLEERKKKSVKRAVSYSGFYWSPKGSYAVLDIRSGDNKDRWLMLWDTANAS